MSPALTKPMLRAAALARREALTLAERAIASAYIARGVEAILRETRPKSVGIYRAYGSEADTMGIIASAEADGLAVALPVMIDRDVVRFHGYRTGDALLRDALAILAPSPTLPAIDPDFLVVPVTAF